MEQDDLENDSLYEEDGNESEEPQNEQEVTAGGSKSKKIKKRGRPKITNRRSRIISVDDEDKEPPSVWPVAADIEELEKDPPPPAPKLRK